VPQPNNEITMRADLDLVMIGQPEAFVVVGRGRNTCDCHVQNMRYLTILIVIVVRKKIFLKISATCAA